MASFRNSGIPIKKTGDVHVSLDRGDAPAGIDSSQWDANPYANFDYRKTWWQNLWEGLGFRSSFDEYKENMALNSREYDAQLAEKAHNEQYDSASAQAARERAAGINPDLAGNVDAGSSSGMEPDPNAPMSPGHHTPYSAMATLETFSNMIMGGFTSAIGLSRSVLGLFSDAEDITSKRNSNRQTIMNDALSWAFRQIPGVYPSNADVTEDNNIFYNGVIADNAYDYALANGYRKKDAKLFSRTVDDWLKSAPGSAQAYDEWYKQGESRIQFAEQRSSDLWSDSDGVLRDLVKPISVAIDRLRKLQPQAEGDIAAAKSSEAQYTEDYYDNLDPSLSAAVQNKTNQRNLASADIDKILNECLDSIIQNLRDRSESNRRGHNLAQGLILIYSLMRMTNFNIGSGGFRFGF